MTHNCPGNRCGVTSPHAAHDYLRGGVGAHCPGVAIRLGGSPPYPLPPVDPTTERMRQEAGHDCIACPTDVRNLAATAHNLLAALDAARPGLGDWARVWRKAEQMREALSQVQTAADGHFEALNAWRRP